MEYNNNSNKQLFKHGMPQGIHTKLPKRCIKNVSSKTINMNYPPAVIVGNV